MSKVLFTYPTDKPHFTAMWAQFSGLADCCGAGVIGRISGLKVNTKQIEKDVLKPYAVPYKPFKTMCEYIMETLPSNSLFAGTPEDLYWAILENMYTKGTKGNHIAQIKAKSVDSHTFDFENNSYHKFWAGPSFRVKMWTITDRSSGTYMSHPADLRCNTFMDYVEKNKLCEVFKTGEFDGSYGTQKLVGAYLKPNLELIGKQLPKVIADLNVICEDRWNTIADYVPKTAKTLNKVSQKW